MSGAGIRNWRELEQDWGKFKGIVRSYLPQLTEEDLKTIRGDRSELSRVLERHFSWTPEEVESTICNFEKEVRLPGATK